MKDVEILRELHRLERNADPDEIIALKGDGSDRRIYRLLAGEETAIGVVGDNIPENRAFLGFTRSFLEAGLRVPRPLAIARDMRAYMIQDFGDTLLFDWQLARRDGADMPREVIEMYAVVLTELVRFQIDAVDRVDFGLCYQHAEFARESMRFDIQYFREMFVGQVFEEMVDEHGFERDADALIAYLCEADRHFFLYRDFQSRNVLINEGAPAFIDYQSGRRGALPYDVASLLYDAKARIPDVVRAELLDGYLREVGTRLPIDRSLFEAQFGAFALIRVMQALGAFGNLGLRKGKTQFLSSIPSALVNLRSLAEQVPLMRTLPTLRALCLHLSEAPLPSHIPVQD